jgi:hypothetical protein
LEWRQPHVAIVIGCHVQGRDGETNRGLGHQTGHRLRKPIADILRQCKETSGRRRTRNLGAAWMSPKQAAAPERLQLGMDEQAAILLILLE